MERTYYWLTFMHGANIQFDMAPFFDGSKKEALPYFEKTHPIMDAKRNLKIIKLLIAITNRARIYLGENELYPELFQLKGSKND